MMKRCFMSSQGRVIFQGCVKEAKKSHLSLLFLHHFIHVAFMKSPALCFIPSEFWIWKLMICFKYWVLAFFGNFQPLRFWCIWSWIQKVLWCLKRKYALMSYADQRFLRPWRPLRKSKRSPWSIGNGSLNIVNAAQEEPCLSRLWPQPHFSGSFSRKFPIAERDYSDEVFDYRNNGYH